MLVQLLRRIMMVMIRISGSWSFTCVFSVINDTPYRSFLIALNYIERLAFDSSIWKPLMNNS